MSRLGLGAALAAALSLLPGRAAAVAPVVKDEGKFFSAEAVKKADEAIREVYRKHGLDLLIETYATVPADQAEKVKKMSREERAKFFRDWAVRRAKDTAVNGVYILVCKDPTNFQIQITGKGRRAFDQKSFNKLREAILDEFRERRFDQGLAAAVKFVGDRFAEAK